MKQKYKKGISPFQAIILGFAALILVGALLLCLPISTRSGEWARFDEALFTSTSAVCVTGLIVQDTASYWSPFGHVILLALIQIGGLGVVTVAVALAILAHRRLGLRQRMTMQEAISAPMVGGIEETVQMILRVALLVECIGAVCLFPAFCRDFGPWKGLFYAFFHSISAFCNAGFDLMGTNAPFSSLTAYAADPLVNLTVIALILIGGIGFAAWGDVRRFKWRLWRYSLQSKAVLLISAVLILFPTLYFFCFENTDAPLGTRLLSSLFLAVTPRTAGFNTVDLTALSEVGQGLMVILMLVGGSSGSTAGGMKMTTLAVLFAAVLSVFRREKDTALFSRRVAQETIRQAAALLVMYLTLLFFGGFAISAIEGLPLLTCVFESASAVCTVGLTLGITPTLSLASRIILMLSMFLGRVGGLTLVYAAFSGHGSQRFSQFPCEKITVG